MADKAPVKIILITGYLGAGKTTLLNKILSNREGIRAAVIVNDIGEVNVDASLIRQGGLSQTDELIPMTNGCICCTLSGDLENQLQNLADSGQYDYIIIEASGICEPIPIAYVISNFCKADRPEGYASLDLDNVVAVVDAARMYDEFNGGKDLLAPGIDEDDVEALLINQIEFCTTLVLNKADLVSEAQLKDLKTLVRGLQKEATIIETSHGEVPLSELLDTGRFDFKRVANSAVWVRALETGEVDEVEDDHDDHGHDHDHDDHDHDDHGHDHGHDHDHDHDEHHHHGHHHHHHHHEDGELEHGITTFVYERRKPFSFAKFREFVEAWPEGVVRVKGTIWMDEDFDMSYLFEQAGRQKTIREMGYFVASFPEDERKQIIAEEPSYLNDWDDEVGDRMNRLVFIGRKTMDRESIEAHLDACLIEWQA